MRDALETLRQQFGDRQIVTDPVELIPYEFDAGFDRGRPDALVFPHDTKDVVQLVRWAAEHEVALVARGAGTGLAGGAVAMQGGVIVNFAQMNRVRELNLRERTATVEPGVVNLDFDRQLASHDLYYPPDPASQRASTIGGNVATNAGGPHCFKYGVTTNYVLGMELVTAEGEAVQLGSRTVDAPEYDLTGLMCGSEGTLGLVTAVRLRLMRRPPALKTMTATFDSVAQAGAAVSAVISAGLVPATLEMMDQKMMGIVEPFAHAGLPVDAGAILLIEVDGYEAGLDAQIERITTILERHGGYGFRIAQTEEERAALWKARKSIAGALARLAPAYYLVDITVPRSRLAETLTEIDALCEQHDLRVGQVMHAGDGNLHPLLVITDPTDAEHVAEVYRAGLKIAELCVRKDGSLSGEHGIGTEKRKYMPRMFTAAELSAMWDVKQVFDPEGRLNPGKIFPDEMPVPPEPEAFDTPPSPPFIPASAEEAARGLAAASAAGRPVYVGANRLPPGTRDAIALATEALTGIVAFAPDDLYVTVGAGTPLVELQRFLAERDLQAPLAAPWPDATVGGLVAANANAPLRLRHGSLRDVVLCTTVALADGRVIRSGRPLVKNVAGYDLTKVFVGSYGTLGVLTDVTLKVTPAPRARRTLIVPVEDVQAGLQWADELTQLAVIASAIVLCTGGRHSEVPDSPYLLAYTAEGWPEDVESELGAVRAALAASGAPEPIATETPTGTDLWVDRLHVERTGAVQIRIGLPPTSTASFVHAQAAPLGAGTYAIDVPHGLLYATAQHGDASAAKGWIQRLRRSAAERGGCVVVLDGPPAWLPALNLWAYRPGARGYMQRLKARWDPAGILNPGILV